MKPRLRWKREQPEHGLARVCQSPRGYDLRLGGVKVGSVRPLRVGFADYDGWFWVACHAVLGIPWRNSAAAGHPRMTMVEAKAACESYVRQCLSVAEVAR